MPFANCAFTGTSALVVLALSGLVCAAGHALAVPGEPYADGPARRSTELAVTSPPDGVTLAADGPGVDTPWLVSPAVRGRGGTQGLVTVRDDSDVLLRLGAGWTDVRATGSAPPFQPVPGRRWNLDDSELAWRHGGGEWYASVQRRHWGPGWTGSLILDGAALPLAAVGWRRPQPQESDHPWLHWMGPWSADVFFARLFGHDEPRRPALVGMRLQLQPFGWLQIGLSRALQWGGRGRREDASTLLRGLLGNDNEGERGVTVANEPGNQLAGFDWRLQLGDDSGSAFYGQMIGEDEEGYLPSAYLVQTGLQTRWRLQGAVVHGFVEWNDLIAGHAYGAGRPPGITYTHSVYRQGYTQDRMPLGHPAGGDTTLGSVGLVVRMAQARLAVVASRGTALPTSQRFAPGRIAGVNGSAQIDLSARQQLGTGLWWWRDSAERQRALQMWWRLLL